MRDSHTFSATLFIWDIGDLVFSPGLLSVLEPPVYSLLNMMTGTQMVHRVHPSTPNVGDVDDGPYTAMPIYHQGHPHWLGPEAPERTEPLRSLAGQTSSTRRSPAHSWQPWRGSLAARESLHPKDLWTTCTGPARPGRWRHAACPQPPLAVPAARR